MAVIKRFLLKRQIILVLILLILGTTILAYIFPQQFSTPPADIEKWHQAHPLWVPWIKRFGLDHIYSTLWFAALLFVFLLALIASTARQIRISMQRTFGHGAPSGGVNIKVNATEEMVVSAIKRHGYYRMVRKDACLRFIKHPWGYWGDVLLHLGIAIVIFSSLLIVLTEKRGLLHLLEGELYIPGSRWLAEEKGILAGSFFLPEAVKLDSVMPEFWETDDLKQLTTVMTFIDHRGRFKKHTLAINQTVNYRGVRIYQSQSFGSAFFIEVVDRRQGRKTGSILQIPHPIRRDKASYMDFQVDGVQYLIRAGYFADLEKRSMNSTNPLLLLKLIERGKIIGEVSLSNGESKQIGPYTFTLVGVSRWAGIIFVDITGMPGIFLGFFLIIMGGGVIYFTPPREVYVSRGDGAVSLTWKASRFERFYEDEYKRISETFGVQR